jgi:hypothetical protein
MGAGKPATRFLSVKKYSPIIQKNITFSISVLCNRKKSIIDSFYSENAYF